MSVVVAHDYLTQRGGAERVALELAQQLGASEVVTSAYHPGQTFDGFSDFSVRQSADPLVRLLRKDPRRALPFLARAWDRMPPVDADVVVCSSSGWSHAVPTTPGTKKVVYCHNPARWLYQPTDFLQDQGLMSRVGLGLLRSRLTAWDVRAAATADVYIANSTIVASRIRDVYGIEPTVVHPPVAVDTKAEQSADDRLSSGFFLSVGRARGYKGVSRLIEAFAMTPDERLVIVGVESQESFPPNVVGVGRVSEARLRWLYASARALVSVSKEDFGLTPIEANAFGTPSLVLRFGGFLDSTVEGVNGIFIPSDEPSAISSAVREFPSSWKVGDIIAHADRFSVENFTRHMTAAINELG
ncbi:glycosyl transferase family 1 [Microbacterium sp. Gd 4-13]|uniref:glycosyltransferase n=1 Tax=Microbacterium sp. Gd 4-13 TaxID=2173179 RepID=UPI000D5832AA|nr:glycosyltransferase [Microbacterium sp. Gd 4-13]PVW02154.1 glycosyl transferase family 1 [Microbacterium sp. Gd 4-13]